MVNIPSTFSTSSSKVSLSIYNKYILFDGLAYNTCRYFASCVVNTAKKIVILQLASIFLLRVFRNTLIPSVKMTLTMNKMFAGIICQTIERKVYYSTTKKKKLFLVLFSGKSIQNIIILSVRMT